MSETKLIFDDAGVTDIKLRLEVSEGYHFFHVEMDKWSHNIFKRHLDILSHALIQLHDLGINNTYAYINNKDSKLRKWIEMFGFEVIREHNDHLLMHRSTV